MSLRHWLALAFVWFAITGCGAAEAVSAQSSPIKLPAELRQAMTREYGKFGEVVTWDGMLNDLHKADLVCIGEAHYDARDMETAFEIARALASKKKIALAVERFSYDMQPALDKLYLLDSETVREAELEAVLHNETYETVWGNNAWNQTGFPVNTPSKPIFEAIVKWAARAGIPIIALDVSLAERQNGLGEDMAFRNEFWKQQIEKFWQEHSRADYQIVVIGGITHLTNAPDALPKKLKMDSDARVISIGQRDAMFHYLSSTQVDTLAKTYSMNDLIIQNPESALVNVKGVATFPAPPDYWIAVHEPARHE